MIKNRRLGRFVLSANQGAPIRWIPRFLRTATRGTDPWIWRLYWLRLCLGLMKTDWDRPVQLTRQLRRQLERKGYLTILPGALPAATARPKVGRG